MSQVIKVCYRVGNHTPLFKLIDFAEPHSIIALINLLNHSFGSDQSGLLTWQDSDGDDISITSDNDLNLFLSIATKPLKLLYTNQTYYPPEPKSESSKATLWIIPKQEFTPRRESVGLAEQVVTKLPDSHASPLSLLPTPLPTLQNNVRRPAMPKLNARFVKHTTCDDESSIYAPGQEFFKTWRFRNDGGLKWPKMIQLLFVSKLTGDQMGGPEVLPIFFPEQIAINAEIDISVPLIAPEKTGEYTGFWKLADESGKKFGQRVRVRIHVAEPIADSALNQRQMMIMSDCINDGFENAIETIKLILKQNQTELSADDVQVKLHKLGIRMRL